MIMNVEEILRRLEIQPDTTSGRLYLPLPIHNPADPGLPPQQKFRLRDGLLFDANNRNWTPEAFEWAVREAGLLPEVIIEGERRCLVCGGPLKGRLGLYCSSERRRALKRRTMRVRRRSPDHQHVCAVCGAAMKVGRPRLPSSSRLR